ncbi:hypothetical protein [Nocardia sp. NBC_00403]|uniref:hypothetical protein n=1 Tax=Nocardia sp. NBC_00403 TaxID=2975990 RepID=UPI002E22E05D
MIFMEIAFAIYGRGLCRDAGECYARWSHDAFHIRRLSSDDHSAIATEVSSAMTAVVFELHRCTG